jgi:Zn-finger nucleic acid-binding protein
VNATCPDCKLALEDVPSGAATARRCPRCRGIWLDPDAFRRLCDDGSRPPDETDALAVARPTAARDPGPRPEDRVRYRPCPGCGEPMARANFGRVSGVLIDVCRPHGAWFDRGELAAIRRFLRGGGLHRFARARRLDAERRRTPAAGAPPRRPASADDVFDVLVGGDGWDVPVHAGWLAALALVFATLGAGLLWVAFDSRWTSRPLDREALAAGAGCLWFAWRALRRWRARA